MTILASIDYGLIVVFFVVLAGLILAIARPERGLATSYAGTSLQKNKGTYSLLAALVCLCAAVVCLSIGVFISSPTSVVGGIFLCLGLLCVLGTITFFVLYRHSDERARG